ncbi:MAG: HAMP domain-containing sensor histidine kinase [Cyanobacteria bacterium P01_H01_bin.35]
MNTKQKSTRAFFRSLRVGQKIGLGYGLAICVVVLGTTTGFIIGDAYHKEALEQEENSLKAYRLVNNLKSKAFLIRIDFSELPILLNEPELLEKKYLSILENQTKSKELWQKFKSNFGSAQDQEKESILSKNVSAKEFFNNYSTFLDLYLERIEGLIKNLDIENLQTSQLETTRREITNFKTEASEKFENFAIDLLDLSEEMYEEYEKSEAEFAVAQELRLTIFVVSAIFSIIVTVLLAILTSKAISQPLQVLTNIAQQVTEEDNFELQVPVSSKDEIGILGSSFNQMIKRVKKLLLEKEERAAELLTINENLKATQSQLVAQEKMASLGSLTAGIAHEINTPLGIGVSAASLLEEKTQVLSEVFYNGKMKRSDLDNYLDVATQSNKMLLSNLKRAAELIQSFKQVAIDRSNEESRTFNLKEYLEDILIQLSPKIKGTKHKIEIQGSEDVIITSYPGAFSQIITNLVINSLLHGYEPEDSGLIVISFHQDNNSLILEYVDDGKGIEPENLQKIFDPFFTTKRNQGGSGLGLHILFNIVNQKLSGTIECESKLGLGTKFIIKIPLF